MRQGIRMMAEGFHGGALRLLRGGNVFFVTNVVGYGMMETTNLLPEGYQ